MYCANETTVNGDIKHDGSGCEGGVSIYCASVGGLGRVGRVVIRVHFLRVLADKFNEAFIHLAQTLLLKQSNAPNEWLASAFARSDVFYTLHWSLRERRCILQVTPTFP